MAKPIFTRRWLTGDALRRYRIVVDGDRGVSIGPGQTVAVELPPGHHELAVRIDWSQSQPVGIEVDPEGHHLFEVGSKLRGWRGFCLASVLASAPIAGLHFVEGEWSRLVLPAVALIPTRRNPSGRDGLSIHCRFAIAILRKR